MSRPSPDLFYQGSPLRSASNPRTTNRQTVRSSNRAPGWHGPLAAASRYSANWTIDTCGPSRAACYLRTQRSKAFARLSAPACECLSRQYLPPAELLMVSNDGSEPLGLGKRERPQQRVVDQRKYGPVRTDRGRERHDGDNRQAGASPKKPDPES